MPPLGSAARQPLSCVTSTRAASLLQHLHRAHDGARDAAHGAPFRATTTRQAPESPRAAARCAPHTRLAPPVAPGALAVPLQHGVVSSSARWAMSEGRRTFTAGVGLRARAEDPFGQQVETPPAQESHNIFLFESSRVTLDKDRPNTNRASEKRNFLPILSAGGRMNGLGRRFP